MNPADAERHAVELANTRAPIGNCTQIVIFPSSHGGPNQTFCLGRAYCIWLSHPSPLMISYLDLIEAPQ